MRITPLLVPAGDDTEIQYNDNYIFGGDPLFVWQNSNEFCGVGLNSPRDTLEVYKRFITDPDLYNTQVGFQAGDGITAGVRNTFGGYNSALYVDSDDNTTLGFHSLGSDGAGGDFAKCTAAGAYALNLITAGADTTTGLGYMAGGRVTTAAAGLYLGPYAGCRQTTVSNRLFIDDRDRTTAAAELTNSLIWGLFDDDPANQTLQLNAVTRVTSLTASLLVCTDADKDLTSVDGSSATLADWITGTANQIIVTDNLDGTITLSLPQDYDTAADPTLGGLNITNCADFAANAITFQPGTDSTTFFQILDADGGTPVFNVDSTNETVQIGNPTYSTTAAFGVNRTISDSTFVFGFTVEGTYTSSAQNAYAMWMNPTLNPGHTRDATGIYSGGTVVADTGTTVDEVVGIHSVAFSKSGTGNITTAYGMKIESPAIGSTNYSIYVDGSAQNYLGGGSTGIAGATSPGYSLQIGTGSALVDLALVSLASSWVYHFEGGTAVANSRFAFGYNQPNDNFQISRYNGGWLDAFSLDRTTNNVGIGEVSAETLLEMTGAAPYITTHNDTHEDADGGRESVWQAFGEQSGGEETTLGKQVFAHDDAADDEKGWWGLYTNAGSDGDSPTLRMTIDSAGAADVVGDFTAGTIQADNGVSGTLVLDDGATEKITLVFTGGLLTSRTVEATTSGVLADWTD